LIADDANIPSLLSLPLLKHPGINASTPAYAATRETVLSTRNPYYYSGSAASGIGGPHNGEGWVWPMSIAAQSLTSQDEKEVGDCLATLLQSSACSGLIHESFRLDSFSTYTRPWFAWANSLFGQVVVDVSRRFPTLLDGTLT